MSFGYSMLGFGAGNLTYYDPGMMTFNGTDSYYSKGAGLAISGTAITAVVRFNVNPVAGRDQTLFQTADSTGYNTLIINVLRSDHATGPNRMFVITRNAANANLYQARSIGAYADGADHVVFVAYDNSGVAQFYVDGLDVDDTGYVSRVLTSGTISTIDRFAVGRNYNAAQDWVAGDIGYCGFRRAYLTNPTGFYHPLNGLREIDESGWTEWGAQPLFWNKYGTMTDNKGSAGNMTANGTISGPS